jgi:hypothetical protein
MKIPLILIAIASTALAQNKGRLLEPEILQPWDRLARDNITITAQTAAAPGTKAPRQCLRIPISSYDSFLLARAG